MYRENTYNINHFDNRCTLKLFFQTHRRYSYMIFCWLFCEMGYEKNWGHSIFFTFIEPWFSKFYRQNQSFNKIQQCTGIIFHWFFEAPLWIVKWNYFFFMRGRSWWEVNQLGFVPHVEVTFKLSKVSQDWFYTYMCFKLLVSAVSLLLHYRFNQEVNGLRNSPLWQLLFDNGCKAVDIMAAIFLEEGGRRKYWKREWSVETSDRKGSLNETQRLMITQYTCAYMRLEWMEIVGTIDLFDHAWGWNDVIFWIPGRN